MSAARRAHADARHRQHGRIRPHHLVIGIGVGIAVFTVVSGDRAR